LAKTLKFVAINAMDISTIYGGFYVFDRQASAPPIKQSVNLEKKIYQKYQNCFKKLF